jgi:hypothetical protein
MKPTEPFMSTEILSDEVSDKLHEFENVCCGIIDTLDAISRLPLDYDDSIPMGIMERNKLLQKLKDGLYEANMIMGQIKPYSKDAEGPRRAS